MAVTNLWGVTTTGDETLETQLNNPMPVIADNGGTEVAVAYVANGQVNVEFLDEQGLPSAARPSTIVSATSPASTITDIAISSTTLGYAVGWTESAAGVDTTYVRYIGLTAAYDVPVAIPGVNITSLSLAGYALDGPDRKLAVDGFNAVWVDENGHVQYQRYAVWLNDAKDPTGPVTPAGLDGIPNTADPVAGRGMTSSDSTAPTELTTLLNPQARDASVVTTHDGEAIIAWVENTGIQDRIRVSVRNVDGTQNALNTVITDIDGAPGIGEPAVVHAHVIQLATGGFVVAWSSGTAILAKEFPATIGTLPGFNTAFSAGAPTVVLQDFGAANMPAGAVSPDFSLGSMIDTLNGYTLTFTVDGNIYERSFTNAGAPLGGAGDTAPLLISNLPANSSVSSASLVGDRVIVVSQTGGSAITSRIVDPRVQQDDPATVDVNEAGLAITVDSRGLKIDGDLLNTKAIPDVLVGTIGKDTIDGGQLADILDGGMGDDSILAGSGDDVIDGGGNTTVVGASGDVLVLTGTQADYTIRYLGGTIFEVADKGTNAVGRVLTGTDFVRNIESFQFSDGAGGTVTVAAATFTSNVPNVTPSAWGLTNEDPDTAPNLARHPDSDGWIVNNGADRAGKQSAPVVSDSVGEFVSVMWETVGADGLRHIKASFLDVLGAPDLVTPLPDNVAVTDGKGDEHGAVVASGGANSGWGFAFLEADSGVDHLKTNFFSLNLTGTETFVDQSGGNQHDAAVYGSFLDRRAQTNSDGSLKLDGNGQAIIDGPGLILPAGMNEGYSVVYVDGGVAGGYGKIQLQRYEARLDAFGQPGAPVAAGIDGLSGTDAQGNTGPGVDAVYTLAASGRNPSITALHTFETFAVWIAQDAGGKEHVVGAAIDDMGKIIPVNLANISGTDTIAAGSNALVASAGAVNAAIVWVADIRDPQTDAHIRYELKATMYSSPGTGLDGTGFGFVAPAAPFTIKTLPENVDLASIKITGISGEGSNDIIVQWDEPDAVDALTSNIMAQHVAVTLDPITGVALSMVAEGSSIQVNAIAGGDQSNNGVAGLLSDRFISVWQDTSTDANGDIVARIHDTRQPRYIGDAGYDPVNDRTQRIVGDFVSPRGVIQTKRDIIVGTIGDDYIQGDISDARGLADELYGGMGNDTLEGGPGLRGAAGVPEIIDGGEGNDTSVYTSVVSDYTITAIFDPVNGAGFEIRDTRATTGVGGVPAQNDGVDNVFSVEFLQFRDGVINLKTDVFNPPVPDKLASFNGTPTAWSLTDAAFAPIDVARPLPTSPANANVQKQISVANLQDDAAMVWTDGAPGGALPTKVFGVRYDITGAPDPLWLNTAGVPGPVEMTDSTSPYVNNTVANPTLDMAGGLGFVGAWESTGGGSTSIHLRFGSTATDGTAPGGVAGQYLFDPGAGFPGYGWAGTEIVVPGSIGGAKPVVKGYEIVNAANDTLEYGFHVAFTDASGNIQLVRYEIPVYNVDPVTGSLGAPPDPAAFGAGAETQPIVLGADGVRGSGDEGALTLVGNGTDVSLATLHDGELVVGFIDSAGKVQVKIFEPTVSATAERDPGAAPTAGQEGPVPGVTTFSSGAVIDPMAPGAVHGAVQHAQVVAQQNGSFGVFWSELDATTNLVSVKANIFLAGTPGGEVTLETGLQSGVEFKVMPAGVDAVGNEAGFVVVWLDSTNHIQGQSFGMNGAKVGDQFAVDPANTHSGLTAAGIDNGLLLIGYENTAINNGDVQVSYLDTRQPGDALLGPRTGAPRDVAVGTTGDDAMDGRNLADQLFGGLGDDVITLGAGADIGDGGLGNDTVLGGSGQDQVLGGDGNDLLLSGPSGPIDVKVDRDLQTGLALVPTVTGLTAAQWTSLVAGEQGTDIVSGGAGIDTISYAKDFGGYRIDLAAGVALRAVTAGTAGSVSVTDNGAARSYILDAVNGAIVDDGAGGTIFQFGIDLENAEGGQRDDVLLGSAANNVLIGGGGNDFIDGRGGTDTAVFSGSASAYSLTHPLNSAQTTVTELATGKVATLQNVEFIQFADERIAAPAASEVLSNVNAATRPNVNTAPVAATDFATIVEDHVAVIKVLANDAAGTGEVADAGQTLTITHVAGQSITAGGPAVAVANGTVALGNNGQLIFTPTANFNGPTSFTYTVNDGNVENATATGTVNINVTPAPDPAIGVEDSFASSLGNPITGNLIANDVNPDAVGGLSVVSVTFNGATYTPGQTVPLTTGNLTFAADGAITFTQTAATAVVETFTYIVQNASGVSSPTTVTLTVLDHVNLIPTVTGDLTLTVAEGGLQQITAADLTFSDGDNVDPALETFTVSNVTNGLVLVQGSGNVLVPATSFTASQVNQGLVYFQHDGSDTTAAQITVSVSDGFDSSAPANLSITVTPVNDAPVLAGATGTVGFTEGGTGVVIAPNVTITDVDSTLLTTAVFTITNYEAEDVLSAAPVGGITSSFSGGVLTLTATAGASLADFVTTLKSVRYVNTNDANPNPTPRTITVQVTDRDANGTSDAVSNVQTITVNVAGVNDAPLGGVTISSATDNGNNTFSLAATNNIMDPDLAAAPAVTYQWQSATSLNGTYANVPNGSLATLDNVAAPSQVPTYYRVQAGYVDPFGTTLVTGTERVLVGTTGANIGTSLSTAGVSVVMAMAGNDTIAFASATPANVVINGGAGTDTVQIQAGAASYAPATNAQLVNVEAVSASTLGTNVTLDLSQQTENLTITGGAGNDTISGSAGADSISGGSGNDTFRNIQRLDTIVGGAGTDAIIVTDQVVATEISNLTDARLVSTEQIDARTAASGVTITLTAQNTEGYTVLGSTGADSLTGGGQADNISGNAGNDSLVGGNGGDTLAGGLGNDNLDGGAGNDVAQFAANVGGYSLDLDAAGNILVAHQNQTATGDGLDTVLANIETLRFNATSFTRGSTLFVGTAANNTLTGTSGNGNIVVGGDGADTLNGHDSGNDALYGDAGRDSLSGQRGNDTLYGGAGADTINGGAGNDTIVFNSTLDAVNNVDQLSYVVAEDTINLDDSIFLGLQVGAGGVLAAASFQSGNSDVAVGGTTAARIIFNSTNGGLLYDADGSGAGAAVKFATISSLTGPMAATEFVVI